MKKIKTEHHQTAPNVADLMADQFGGFKGLKNLPVALGMNPNVFSPAPQALPFKSLAQSYLDHFKDQLVAAATVAAAMANASASASASPSPSSTSSVSSKSTAKSSSASSSFNTNVNNASNRSLIAGQVNSFSRNQQQQQPHYTRSSTTPSPALSASPLPMFPSNGGGGPVSTKQIKCVLPPVSQEQFDKYSLINTDDLVKRVKDLLSKYSISQRLFGECILGLSQGSVSDLLARPKPWMMLTQKGREPFIRMQMFIDDPEAIKRLMANQYKTTSLASSASNSSSTSNLTSIDSVSNTPSQAASMALKGPASMAPVVNKNSFSLTAAESPLAGYGNGLRMPIGSPQLFYANHPSNNSSNNDNSNDSSESNMKNSSSTYQAANSQQSQVNIIPYDISQLSSVGELNTDEITNRVKETLLNNNIGQKLFGEAVLNLSQGTVSELLSKPKPWNTLSIKGREPYLRMYMWLNDTSRLDKLNEWKEEKNMLKRINAVEHETPSAASGDQQKPKRRFIFTEEQKDQLLKAFKYDPYPAVNQMELLATKLNLATRTVINWFHNHRMRIRYKSTSAAASSSSWSPNGGGSNTPVSNPYELSPTSSSSKNHHHHHGNNNSAASSAAAASTGHAKYSSGRPSSKSNHSSSRYVADLNNNNNNKRASHFKDANSSSSMYASAGNSYNSSKHGTNYDEDEDEDEEMNENEDGALNQYDDDEDDMMNSNQNNDNEDYYEMNPNEVEYDEDEVDANNNNMMIHSDEQDNEDGEEHQNGAEYYSTSNNNNNNYDEYSHQNNNEQDEEEEEDEFCRSKSAYKPGKYQDESSSAALDDEARSMLNNNNKRRKPHNPQKLNSSLNSLFAKKFSQQQS